MSGWAQLWLQTVPVLPATGLLRVGLHLGWAVVLAWLIWHYAARWVPSKPLAWASTLTLAAWALVPGPWGGAYWLGLAFQSPSASAVVLCGWLLGRQWRGTAVAVGAPWRRATAWALAAAVLGWVLLLDAFALWPVPLYALGFGAGLPLLAFAVVACVWVWERGVDGGMAVGANGERGTAAPSASLVVMAALMVHILLRMPTGNVWDALLDPWLWLGLQLMLAVRAWRWWRSRP